jgi:hypothetical protein
MSIENKKTPGSKENYTVLVTPGSVTIPVVTYAEHGKLDGLHEYYTVYAQCKVIKETALPLNSNPRLPNSIGSNPDKDVVLSMRRTLSSSNSEDFVKFNNGMTIVCNDIVLPKNSKKSEVTLSFGDFEGILNGGHTYFAIQSTPDIPDEAKVRLEIIKLNPNMAAKLAEKKAEILKIAMNRNKNRILASHTQANYEGKYEPFKEHLADAPTDKPSFSETVNWAEGHSAKSGAIGAKDFIRMMTSLDPMWFNHPLEYTNPDHESACVSDPHDSTWKPIAHDVNNQHNLLHMAPLSRSLVVLYETIRMDLMHGQYSRAGGFSGFRATNFYAWAATKGKKDSLIFTDGDTPPKPIKVSSSKPIFTTFALGMLRPTVWFGEDQNDDIRFIGFVSNPVDLFNAIREKLYKEVETNFTADFAGKDGRRLVGSKVFHAHYRNLVAKITTFDYDFPECFYSFDHQKWYRKSSTSGIKPDVQLYSRNNNDYYEFDKLENNETGDSAHYYICEPPF